MEKTHGMRNHRLYYTWYQMKYRCNVDSFSAYRLYGGKGIKVCDRWLDINNFIDDMYPTFKDGLTLDRINVNGHYEPSNCRWATKSVQSRNVSIRADNTSGYKGVSINKRSNRWVSTIKVKGKVVWLGTFDTAKDACVEYNSYIINNNLEHTLNVL